MLQVQRRKSSTDNPEDGLSSSPTPLRSHRWQLLFLRTHKSPMMTPMKLQLLPNRFLKLMLAMERPGEGEDAEVAVERQGQRVEGEDVQIVEDGAGDDT